MVSFLSCVATLQVLFGVIVLVLAQSTFHESTAVLLASFGFLNFGVAKICFELQRSATSREADDSRNKAIEAASGDLAKIRKRLDDFAARIESRDRV